MAYVRFASVYRRFKTLEELVEEARAVIDAKRYEDPTQGRLFIDVQQAANGGHKPPVPADAAVMAAVARNGGGGGKANGKRANGDTPHD